jgi:hypothetical protein
MPPVDAPAAISWKPDAITGGAQTTHEYLIPITRFFSVVQSGWLGILLEEPDRKTTLRVRTLANALRQLQVRAGWTSTDCRDSPLRALAILHETESGTPLKVNGLIQEGD